MLSIRVDRPFSFMIPFRTDLLSLKKSKFFLLICSFAFVQLLKSERTRQINIKEFGMAAN